MVAMRPGGCSLHACVLAVTIVACRFDSGGLDSGADSIEPTSSVSATTSTTGVDSSTAAPTSTTMAPDGASTSTSTSDADASTSTSTSDADATTSTTGPGCPADWWNVEWTQRRELRVAGDALVRALGPVVVPVRLAPNILDFAAIAKDGDDLRFVQDDAVVPYEIERWDPEGESLVWLSLPALPTDGATLHLYYGNPDATTGSNGETTWPDSYVSVHHLEDFSDATGNGHDCLTLTPPETTEGPMAGASEFDGMDDMLEMETSTAYDLTTDLTVEAWIRVTTFDAAWQAIVTKGDDAWRLSRNNQTAFVAFVSDPPNNSALPGVTAVDDDQWHHVAVTYRAQTKRVYVDGVLDAEAMLAGPMAVTTHAVRIGANAQTANREFAGAIDEVRISSVAHPADYFALQYAAGTTGVTTFFDADVCG